MVIKFQRDLRSPRDQYEFEMTVLCCGNTYFFIFFDICFYTPLFCIMFLWITLRVSFSFVVQIFDYFSLFRQLPVHCLCPKNNTRLTKTFVGQFVLRCIQVFFIMQLISMIMNMITGLASFGFLKYLLFSGDCLVWLTLLTIPRIRSTTMSWFSPSLNSENMCFFIIGST